MRKNLAGMAMIAFSLGFAPGLSAQEARGEAQLGGAQIKTEVQGDLDTSRREHPVSHFNKASSLIGMNVKNRQNETVGEIKDLVLDLESGRVYYAVMSVGGFLGVGDRYVALPLHALETDVTDRGLVLNTTKERLEKAPTIAQNNWPNPSAMRAEAGAYWPAEARGGADATVRTGRAEGASASAQAKVDRDRDFGEKEGEVFEGRVTAVHPETRTITVAGESGSRTFKLAERPALTVKANRNPTLIDFKVGYGVSVGYHQEGDQTVAHSIIRTDTGEVR